MKAFRLIHNQECGSIAGKVTNLKSDGIAYVMVGEVTIASSPVNARNGHFTIPSLFDGTYIVLVKDANGRRYKKTGVTATLGKQTNLGGITLQ